MLKKYDIIVVGGGHAGCEAATAAARMGSSVLLISIDMTKFAMMSCNPAVGGVAKGQIVREIDALGGQMGIITDKSTIQFRMLNMSKGPAMWSPRAQCDKFRFTELWRETLDRCDRLYLWQDNVTELLVEEGRVVGVKTEYGVEFFASAVVLTNGTFLGGQIHVGRRSGEGGRMGDRSSYGISAQLLALGFEVERMKTGTPVRLDARTIDFSKMIIQNGDEKPRKFSFLNSISPVVEQLPCYLVYTSLEVHNKLRDGVKDSPLGNGIISGRGPRYCPSIEDKLKTFASKDEHQLFLEPEGATTNEYYLNGFSSSLPWEVQIEALQMIEGMENVQAYRPGYAIEYDYFPPTQLFHTLETKKISNLYFAGQINGTTGYEEAAAQGLIAAINAHQKIHGLEEFILGRDEAYIGVLIDDLVTKGVDEPYRMFTSRAEYRILLRQDNADIRLTEKGYLLGLADEERYQQMMNKKNQLSVMTKFIYDYSVGMEEINPFLISIGQSPITQKRKLSDVAVRNGITLQSLVSALPVLSSLVSEYSISDEVIESVDTLLKYGGYIARERELADKIVRLEGIKIHPDFDFSSLTSLSIEARQKLSKIRPHTIGQASRISGVSPADINVLLVYFGR
ncbi:MAG: tRNA uridine-5-carboxymethylaminomethyl(34) synthesis enzyme MnmG [Rikenellaceae bacterium]